MTSTTSGRLAVLAALVVLAACGGDGDDDETVASTTTSTTAAASSTTASTARRPAANAGPLVGLPIEPSRAGRPLLIVKIDNAPKARPQAGINQADVVVEEAVEGGVTRFATFFHAQEADPVGPVRSARSTDILIATPMNRPLFSYSGANAVFQRQVNSAPLVNVGVDVFPAAYYRNRSRPAPYNLFSATSRLFGRAPSGAGPPPPLFSYRSPGAPLTAAGATPASGVAMEYRGRILTAVQYTWDGPTSTWRRTQDGGPHVDASGVQVAPKNVIVQFVTYKDTGLRDTSGEPVPEGELLGEGEAWIFSDGKVVKGRWRKSSPEAMTQYLDGAGAPVPLTPGQTWVELPKPGMATIR